MVALNKKGVGMNKTLLKASGNKGAFTHAENAPEVYYDLDINDKDAVRRQIAREQFKKNYDALRKRIKDPGWRRILDELAQTPEGMQVLANITPNMKVEISQNVDGAEASFDGMTNRLRLKQNNQNNRTGIGPHGVLLHELNHSAQANRKQSAVVQESASPKEAMISNYMVEADSVAQHSKIDILRDSFNDFHPSAKKIERFMKEGPFFKGGEMERRLLKRVEMYRKDYEEENIPFNRKEFIRQEKKRIMNTDEYKNVERFCKILKQTKGNLQKAKDAYGKEVFKEYISGKNANWAKISYLEQGMSHIKLLHEKGVLSKEDKGMLNKIYAAIGKKYGMKPSEVAPLVNTLLKTHPEIGRAIRYGAENMHLSNDELIKGYDNMAKNNRNAFSAEMNRQAMQMEARAGR